LYIPAGLPASAAVWNKAAARRLLLRTSRPCVVALLELNPVLLPGGRAMGRFMGGFFPVFSF
jgi:hypothetical protein